MKVIERPRYGPILGALVFWIMSMWPTLLPRSWVVQGVVSGVCAAVGWLVGLGVGHLVHRVLAATGHPPTPGVRRTVWMLLAVLGPIAAVVALVQWQRWQHEQRSFIGMPELAWWHTVPVLLVSLVVLAVFVLIARVLVVFVRWIDRRVERVIPRWWARLAVTAGIVVVVVVVVNVARDEIVSWADTSFGAVNDTTPEGVEQPTSSLRSGGPDSLVPWDTLGNQGQAFTGGGPSVEDIKTLDLTGEAMEPIRVYVGLDSADDLDARIDLVMRELERSGAFERELLVVWTATGTGWINPDAAQALELMHGGNTAIVSVQYSFLPSWIAFLLAPHNAAEAGVALFDAVHERWSQLPADSRPELVVYGESLGSDGGEEAFAGGPVDEALGRIVDQTDGALFVGPVASNVIYSAMVRDRDAGSPSWRPEIGAVPELRVVNRRSEIDPMDPAWPEPRILYMHHPTDAVGTWTPAALWRPPEWTDHPLGYAVPRQVMWFPVVTWVQETADLMAGFSAKTGYGHDYNDAFVAAWAAVAPPDGWTADDTAHLQALLPDE